MQHGRSGTLVGLGAYILPQIVEEQHVARDLVFSTSLGGGTCNESAHGTRPFALQNALQAEAFLIARDLARHAHVFERWHIDYIPPWQRDVRRAWMRAPLGPERLLGDLNDDFLAFFRQVADGGLALIGARDGMLGTLLAFLPRLFFANCGCAIDLATRHFWIRLFLHLPFQVACGRTAQASHGEPGILSDPWPRPRRRRRDTRCGKRPPRSRTDALPDSATASPGAAPSVDGAISIPSTSPRIIA